MIIYTNKFIPKRFAGITYQILFTPLSIILIRPQYNADKGLLAHEQTHARQIKHNWLWELFYDFSKKHRLKYEAEAYKEQIKYCTNKQYCINKFAEFLATKYNLNITKAEAMEALGGK